MTNLYSSCCSDLSAFKAGSLFNANKNVLYCIACFQTQCFRSVYRFNLIQIQFPRVYTLTVRINCQAACENIKVDVKSVPRIGSAHNKGGAAEYKNCPNFAFFELF